MPYADDSLVKYVPLVRKLALQLLARLPASVELDDLVQAGMIGLMDACRRYQETADAQFETYATVRIRGAMMDELRDQDWLRRSVRVKAKKIEQAIQQLEQMLLRDPTEGEIAARLNLSLPEYHTLLQEAHGVQIFHYEDLTAGCDLEAEGIETPNEAQDSMRQNNGDPLKALLSKDLRQALIQAIEKLPEREKLLLSLCYEHGLNLKEIGAIMKVTEARVCQLRTQATTRIRAYLRERAWHHADQDQLSQVI
jgi:RNA polymerase sigma factor for flagellar operon FliA